jgi:hypothetical protein
VTVTDEQIRDLLYTYQHCRKFAHAGEVGAGAVVLIAALEELLERRKADMNEHKFFEDHHDLTDEQLIHLMSKTRLVMSGSKEEMDKYHADMILIVDAMRKMLANMEKEKKDENEQA